MKVALLVVPLLPIVLKPFPPLWSDKEPSAKAIAEALSAVYFLAWATYNLLIASSNYHSEPLPSLEALLNFYLKSAAFFKASFNYCSALSKLKSACFKLFSALSLAKVASSTASLASLTAWSAFSFLFLAFSNAFLAFSNPWAALLYYS